MIQSRGEGHSQPKKDMSVNEDSFFVDDKLGLYVVCDGYGGAEAGEVASRIAVDAIEEYFKFYRKEFGKKLSDSFVTRAIQHAFNAIYEQEQVTPAFKGMKTTLTMLIVRGNRAIIGHVGDSRMYIVRKDELTQLTIDHPLTDQQEGDESILSSIDVDTFSFLMKEGDLFFLCTDGLNPVMADSDFVLEISQSENLSWIAEKLLIRESQLDTDGDATCILVRYDEEDDRGWLKHYVSREYQLFRGFAVDA